MSTARIDEVVGEFVTLKKRGVNLIACCPFHNEKSPSFSVSPVRGIYKCFGCGKGGNSATFLMEHEQMSYTEALRFLAKKYNIEVEEDRVNPDEAQALNSERESILITLNYAGKYFHDELLQSEEGRTIGLSYFTERGFRRETIEKFSLGYSHDSRDKFFQNASKNGYTKDALLKSGLIIETENADIIDRYRGRVIFPIHNVSGKVVAFAGRVLKKDEKTAKYVNSPETLVYHKSDLLYGLYFAKNAIRKEDSCFLVEGYTDVITLMQSGVENVVASSGTSLTEQQVRLINRFTKNIVLLYDGDAAGIKAALRGVDLLLQGGLNVKVVLFPDGEDPDSYCKKVGGSAFNDFIHTNSKDFIVFKSELLEGEYKNDITKKADAIHQLVESISKIPDPIQRSLYVSECSRRMQIDEQLLNAEITKLRKEHYTNQTKAGLSEELEKAQEVLDALLDQKDEDAQMRKLISTLLTYGSKEFAQGQSIAEYIFQYISESEIPIDNILYETILNEAETMENFDLQHFYFHPNPEISKLAVDLTTNKYSASPNWDKRDAFLTQPDDNFISDLTSTLYYLNIRRLLKLIEQNDTELKNPSSPEKEIEALQMAQVLNKMKIDLAKKYSSVVLK